MKCVCPICGKSATKICSACHLVSYCSVGHQKHHWKEHKKNCQILQVKQNEVLGRYLVAARDIAPGTVIMEKEALAVGPKQNSIPVCLSCYRKANGSFTCSKCYYPMCDVSCEKMPVHADNECKIFRRNPVKVKISNFEDINPAYECILALRCLLLKEKDPKKWKALESFEPHNEIRRQLTDQWERNEINTVKRLREKYGMMEFDEMAIHSVLGYADVNAFEILVGSTQICGLFPDVALMAHECISNTHHTITDDFKMIVRVTIPIKKGDLITTTYTNSLDGTLYRRQCIRESKFFDCVCKRCSDPTEMGTHFSSIKCTERDCAGFILPSAPLESLSKWICTKCTFSLPVGKIQAVVDRVECEIAEARKRGSCKKELIGNFEEILERNNGKILHPNHYLIVSLIRSLCELYGRAEGCLLNQLTVEQLNRKESLCRSLLRIMDVIEPGLSRIRGLTQYELHAPLYMLAHEQFNNDKVSKSELRDKLDEVLVLLENSYQILSFDSPTSNEGIIAQSIPETITGIKNIRDHFCCQ